MNKPGTQLLSIGEAAAALGVAVATLRRWHRQVRLLPALRTLGGHRRYASEAVRVASGAQRPAAGKTICCARVSSHDEVVTDLGSGLNYRKNGLQRILNDIFRGRVSRLVIVTKDRLLRFGSELLFQICQFFGVEVVVLDATAAISREQQLTEDLVEILTDFSSRLYGSRSRKNLRALAG